MLIVRGFISSLKVAVTFVASNTLVAPDAGVVETTIGQIPLVPASSVTFLQPAATMKSNNRDIHGKLGILENRL